VGASQRCSGPAQALPRSCSGSTRAKSLACEGSLQVSLEQRIHLVDESSMIQARAMAKLLFLDSPIWPMSAVLVKLLLQYLADHELNIHFILCNTC